MGKITRKKKPLAFVVEFVDPRELQAHPKNYVVHPDDEIEHIATSIKQHGLYKNVVIARDRKTILAGHGVVQAALKLKLQKVPVVRLDLDPDHPRALKVLSGDNEIRHLAEVDDYALSQLLMEIKENDQLGLLGTGYDEMMLANLVFITRPESEIKDFNEAAEWVGLPNYMPEAEPIRITVSFQSPKDVQKFAKALGIEVSEKTRALWYPPRKKDDTASLKFQ